MQPSVEALHHCGSVLARPASLTTMAIRWTDTTLKPPDQACWWNASSGEVELMAEVAASSIVSKDISGC
jgi:hypothetical protein